MLISKSPPSFGAFPCRGERTWQAGQQVLCSLRNPEFMLFHGLHLHSCNFLPEALSMPPDLKFSILYVVILLSSTRDDLSFFHTVPVLCFSHIVAFFIKLPILPPCQGQCTSPN